MVAELPLVVDCLFGEPFLPFERLRGQVQRLGHCRNGVLLEPTQQTKRLWREEQLTEAEGHTGADQRVGQPVIPHLAVVLSDGQDITDCRLREQHARTSESTRDYESHKSCERQRTVPIAENEWRKLCD